MSDTINITVQEQATAAAEAIKAREDAEGFAANLNRAGISSGDAGKIERIKSDESGWENVFESLTAKNVKNYGAIGDGINNDSTGIQAAIDDLPSGGGIIFLPEGEYKLEKSILQTKKHLKIIGSGWNTTLKPISTLSNDNADGQKYTIDVEDSTSIADILLVRDLSIEGKGTADADPAGIHGGPGIRGGYVKSTKIINTGGSNGGAGGAVDISSGSANFVVADSLIETARFGIKLTNTNNVGCRVYGNYIDALSAGNDALRGIAVESGKLHSLYANVCVGFQENYRVATADDCDLTGNISDGAWLYGVVITGDRNSWNGGNIVNSDGSGMRIGGNDNTVFINRLWNNGINSGGSLTDQQRANLQITTDSGGDENTIHINISDGGNGNSTWPVYVETGASDNNIHLNRAVNGDSGVALSNFVNDNGTNTYISRGEKISTRVFRSTNQSIANNSYESIVFDSERFDLNDIFDDTTTSSTITIPENGKYSITANIAFFGNSTGIREVRIKTGSTVIAREKRDANSGDAIINLGTIYDFSQNDTIEVDVLQTSGGALDVLADGNFSPVLTLTKID